MLILETNHIKKYYAERLIINLPSFKIYKNDRIGIVGQNGIGKTTLMNLLAGELSPDEGRVNRYCSTAYIKQFSNEFINADDKMLNFFDLKSKKSQTKWSGGEQTRLKLANAFYQDNVLLFADEPTANLDCKGIELLKEKLRRINSFVLISHDRDLLDEFCNKIAEIKNGNIKIYNGNYSLYQQQSTLEYQQASQEYEIFITEKHKLQTAVLNRKNRAKSIKKAPARMGNSEARLHKRASAEKQEKIHNAANSLITRIEKLEKKERPEKLQRVKIDFSLTNPPHNKIIISCNELNFSYRGRCIFERASLNIYNGSKTALYGDNGVGKTTLLNILYRKNNNVNIVPKAKIGYFQQGFDHLDTNKSVLENVMQESIQTETVARTILARLLIAKDNVYKKIHMLSGGEKIKVAFAKLFVSDANVLFLDEPTNYLDIPSIEALEEVLLDYKGTILFVSHDKAFIKKVANRILLIEKQNIVERQALLSEAEKQTTEPDTTASRALEATIIQMRMAEISARLSTSAPNTQALENEYQHLAKQLQHLF